MNPILYELKKQRSKLVALYRTTTLTSDPTSEKIVRDFDVTVVKAIVLPMGAVRKFVDAFRAAIDDMNQIHSGKYDIYDRVVITEKLYNLSQDDCAVIEGRRYEISKIEGSTEEGYLIYCKHLKGAAAYEPQVAILDCSERTKVALDIFYRKMRLNSISGTFFHGLATEFGLRGGSGFPFTIGNTFTTETVNNICFGIFAKGENWVFGNPDLYIGSLESKVGARSVTYLPEQDSLITVNCNSSGMTVMRNGGTISTLGTEIGTLCTEPLITAGIAKAKFAFVTVGQSNTKHTTIHNEIIRFNRSLGRYDN